METWKSMIAWLILTVVIHQNGCDISAQSPSQPYSVSLSPYENSGFQGRLIPILNLNGLFNKNPTTNNNAALAALQREVNALTARVAALEASLNKFKARVATFNSTINCTNGFKLVRGQCYMYVTTAKTFVMAGTACKSLSAHLALPRISVSNNAWGIAIKRAFPAADKFWIGVYYTNNYQISAVLTPNPSKAYDLDGNEISTATFSSNIRWSTRPPGNIPDPADMSPKVPYGVFVTIPQVNPGNWKITPDGTRGSTRPYLCQKR